MADRGSREGPITTRRQSFRKSLADAAVPQEYLDALDQKRRQLDESIHKYVAAKERDYKQFEKELRQHFSSSHEKEGDAGNPRRTSVEPAHHSSNSPRNSGQQHQQHQAVVDVLLSAGLKREQIGQSVAVSLVENNESGPVLEAKSVAGLTDRRASVDRDREFVGVFTPAFLPALENKSQANRERTASAPPVSSFSSEKIAAQPENGVVRAYSDSVADADHRRPAHLQLVQRTSSSGSSADGKLTSAMKSPTHTRPKRKRVSLAVGDTIVAPSDNVPVSMNHHSTPSHSRTRSTTSERENNSTKAIESLRGVQKQPVPSALPPQSIQSIPTGGITKNDIKLPDSTAHIPDASPAKAISEAKAVPPTVPTVPTPPKTPSQFDPDGDLFDLDDEDELQTVDSYAIESDDEDEDGDGDGDDDITGRVDSREVSAEGEAIYDANAGLISEESNDHVGNIEFISGSAGASQQPINAGFRRPSVTSDPVYVGANYARAETDAATNEIYGSSFARPSKGSFTAGSLGESFMARNAEMIRNRNTNAQETEHTRS